MRVKFGNRIKLAKRITHTENTDTFLVTTFFDKEIYVVNTNMPQEETERMWEQIFTLGYVDFSNFEYSNA